MVKDLSCALVKVSGMPKTSKQWDRETPLATKRRARKINRMLAEAYPDAHAELDFTNPLELLVATVLSAQCTDVRVNMVTPALFQRYPSAADYAQADMEELEAMIKPTGFFRAKAKSIVGLATALEEKHGGEVPGDLDSLTALPGVGRKTANVVLGNAFDVPGITVDTHLGRMARRWKITEHEDAVKVEKDLMELIEPKEWTMFSHRAIFHGRRVCHSRKAACGACLLSAHCPSYGIAGPKEPEEAAALIKSADKEHLLELAGVTSQDFVPTEKTR